MSLSLSLTLRWGIALIIMLLAATHINAQSLTTTAACNEAQGSYQPKWDIPDDVTQLAKGLITNSATEFCMDPLQQYVYFNSHGNFFWFYRVDLNTGLVDVLWQNSILNKITQSVTSCVVDPTNTWVYVSTQSALVRLSTGYSSSNYYIPLSEDAWGLSYDPTNTYIYITTFSQTVVRAVVNDMRLDTTWSSPVNIHRPIQIDRYNMFGYYWDPMKNVIRRLFIANGTRDMSWEMRQTSSPQFLAFDASRTFLYVADDRDEFVYRLNMTNVLAPARDWKFGLNAYTLEKTGSMHLGGKYGEYMFVNLLIPDSYSNELSRFQLVPNPTDCYVSPIIASTAPSSNITGCKYVPNNSPAQPGSISPNYAAEISYGPLAALDTGFWSQLYAPIFIVPDPFSEFIYASTHKKNVLQRFSSATGAVDSWSFSRADYGSPLAFDRAAGHYLYFVLRDYVCRVGVSPNVTAHLTSADAGWRVSVPSGYKLIDLVADSSHTFIYAILGQTIRRINVATASWDSAFLIDVQWLNIQPRRIQIEDINNMLYFNDPSRGVYRISYTATSGSLDTSFYVPLQWFGLSNLLDIELDTGGSLLYAMDANRGIRRVDLTKPGAVTSLPLGSIPPSPSVDYNRYYYDETFFVDLSACACAQLMVFNNDESGLLISSGYTHLGWSSILRVQVRCDFQPILESQFTKPTQLLSLSSTLAGANASSCYEAQVAALNITSPYNPVNATGTIQSFVYDSNTGFVYVSDTNGIFRYSLTTGVRDVSWSGDASLAPSLVSWIWNTLKSWTYHPMMSNRPHTLRIDGESTYLYFIDPNLDYKLRRLFISTGLVDSSFDVLTLTGVTAFTLDANRNSLYWQSGFCAALRLDTLSIDWTVNPNFYRGAIYISTDTKWLYNLYPGYNLQRYDLSQSLFQNFYPYPPIYSHRAVLVRSTPDFSFSYWMDADTSSIRRIDNTQDIPFLDSSWELKVGSLSSFALIFPKAHICWSRYTSTKIMCGSLINSYDRPLCVPPVYSWQYLEWSVCSVTCGNGTQVTTPVCAADTGEINWVGEQCENLPKPLPIVRVCPDLLPCDRNCTVGNWTAWGNCSSTCGSGTQTRTRPIINTPLGTGGDCPSLSESRACLNLSACPLGGWNVSDWTPCSVTCGGGVQTRTVKCQPKPGQNFTGTLTPIQKGDDRDKVDDKDKNLVTDKDYYDDKDRFDDDDKDRYDDKDKKCSRPKPATIRQCNTFSCGDCTPQWIVPPFGVCNKNCGGGKRTRMLSCTACSLDKVDDKDGKTVKVRVKVGVVDKTGKKCKHLPKAHTHESCNTQKCLKGQSP